jgi:hypothetical protein
MWHQASLLRIALNFKNLAQSTTTLVLKKGQLFVRVREQERKILVSNAFSN